MAISSGVIKTERISVKLHKESSKVPAKVDNALIQNVGVSDIRLSFDSAGRQEYFTLKAGKELPVLNVQGATTKINHQALVEDGRLEILYWG